MTSLVGTNRPQFFYITLYYDYFFLKSAQAPP